MPPSGWDEETAFQELAAFSAARSGWTEAQRAHHDAGMLRNYVATFESSAGREVFRDLVQHYLYRTSHVPGDPYTTAYQEGQRSVVLAIRKAMAAGRQTPRTAEEGP